MSSPFKTFGTSNALEISGVWLNFGGFEIKVARAGPLNQRYTVANEKNFEPHRRAAEVGALRESDAIEALAKTYADTIILGWRTKNEDGSYRDTIDGEDGAPLEFNRENVIMVMTALPDFFAKLRQHAQDYQTFRSALLETDRKN